MGIVISSAIAWMIVYLLSQKISCVQGTISCNNYINTLDGFVRAPFILSVVVSAIFLMFFSERAFRWWRWFAIISVPTLAWWITTAVGEIFGHSVASLFSGVFFAVGTIFIAISASIYNYFKIRKTK